MRAYQLFVFVAAVVMSVGARVHRSEADEPASSTKRMELSRGTGSYDWFEPPAHYVHFSPDGKWLLAAKEAELGRCTFAIADVEAHRVIQRFEGHDSPWLDNPGCRPRMNTAVFTPNRKKLVTIVSNDQELRLWDATEGKLLAKYKFQIVSQAEAKSKAGPRYGFHMPIVIAGQLDGFDLAITIRSCFRLYRLGINDTEIVELEPPRVMAHVGRGFLQPTSHVGKVATFSQKSADAYVSAVGIWDSQFDGVRESSGVFCNLVLSAPIYLTTKRIGFGHSRSQKEK